jgi:hypothetical protein
VRQILTWQRIQWIVLPLLVFGCVEWLVRQSADFVPTWYAAADEIARSHRIGAIFIGSSRVQAAVEPAQFAAALEPDLLTGRQVLNLGRGYSTEAEHYLGLRNLMERHSEAMQGVHVFAEAPGGLPYRVTWAGDAWAFSEQPWMLVDLLRPSDLPAFWQAPGLGIDERLHITLRSLLRSARLFNRRERVREQWLQHVLPQLASGRLPDLRPAVSVGYDLQGPGDGSSIRVDPEAVAQARASAVDFAGAIERAAQAPTGDWRGTIQDEMSQLVRRHGGRLVYFEPPLSEVFEQPYRTEIRRQDITAFADQARAWGGCVIRPEFTYTDEDFPDLWHLRPSLVPEFSAALARAFARQCLGPSDVTSP